MILVSIDPGLTGAVAFFAYDASGRSTLVSVEDIPTAQAKQGKSMKSHLLLPALADVLCGYGVTPDVAIIEEVNAMPGQGVTSMFRFGHTAGAIAGVCAGLRMRVHHLRPQAWQKAVQLKQGDDAGRLRACQLWPSLSHFFSRKKDHNRADAALIGQAWFNGAR